TLRLTADDSALSVSDDIVVTVNSGGTSPGSLTFSNAPPPANVDLTAEGTADWAHWGLGGANGFNRKSGAAPQISNYTKIGSGAVRSFTDNPTLYSWTDGAPVSTVTDTGSALYIMGLNR